MTEPLVRSLGAVTVTLDGDRDLLAALGPLVEIFDATPLPDVPTVRFERAHHAAAPPVPRRARDFHAGVASGWVEGATIWIDGVAGTIAVTGPTVSVYRLPSPELREQFALVDAGCALMMALRSHRRWHVHGACWDVPGVGACLLAGESGAGKSTTSIAAVLAGARWSSDDTSVLFDGPGGQVWTGGILRMFHITSFTERAFPTLGARLIASRSSLLGKGCLDPLAAFGPTWEPRERPLAMVAVPVVHDGPTAAEPIAMADALGALIESSAWVTVDALADAADHMATLGRACAQARVVRLFLGRDLLDRPEILLDVLRGT